MLFVGINYNFVTFHRSLQITIHKNFEIIGFFTIGKNFLIYLLGYSGQKKKETERNVENLRKLLQYRRQWIADIVFA